MITRIKRNIFILFILILSFQTEGQKRISYYDVFDVVKSSESDRAYSLLLAVQRQDPESANTYFQLGIISKKWAFEFNPFTEYDYIKTFIYNTKLYFDLALLKIEKEKKKNLEFYTNADIKFTDSKPNAEEIISYINTQKKEIEKFEDEITNIISYFNNSSDHYNDCVNIYMSINAEYNKVKNIYLTEDETFLSQLNLLENHFDSTIFYFEKYKDALKEYPLTGYNQEIELKEIITYRLDGLTNSNFLDNNIVLWDYKKWVKSVDEKMEKDVAENRKMILEQDTKMKNQIIQLQSNDYSDVYEPIKVDDKFIYKIEKFDNKSLLIKLFKLNEALINYLSYFRKNINDPQKNDSYNLSSKANYCYNLFEKKKVLDSINMVFNSSIDPVQFKKYQKFYNSSYKGIEGLKDYSLTHKDDIIKKQEEAFNSLKNKLYTSVYNIAGDSLIYKGKQIELKKNFPALKEINPGSYFVTDIKKTQDNITSFSGFYKNKKGKISGFLGASSGKTKLKFIKTKESDTSNIYNLVTDVYRGGSYTIETSVNKSIINTLVHYNEKGELISRRKIPFKKFPRFIEYDDINNSIIIVLNGNNLDETVSESTDEQVIFHLNTEEDSKSFVVRIPAKTYIFDIIKTEGRIFIFSNYIYFLKNDGQKSWSKAGNSDLTTNVSVSIINSEGVLERHIPIDNEHAFFGTKALKLNSNTINILGYKSTYVNKDFSKLISKELYYLLIDSEAKKIYSTWHD